MTERKDTLLLHVSRLKKTCSTIHTVTFTQRRRESTGSSTSEPQPPQHEYSFRVHEYLSESVRMSGSQPPTNSDEDDEGNGVEEKVDAVLDLFQKT